MSSLSIQQPIVLNIRKTDLQEELRQIQQTNLSQAFFKKKVGAVSPGPGKQTKQKPVKPSLKIFG